ncbi:RIP metalloprotease RseP [Dechloromonas sp. HYN0024]|uniref:RIP metalloprotease RseP n=1 Tax=Dechloromonas sp. HYN0024 TaxID=2231055 RepID=UPI000E448E5F|nr:RIP metalloprotease RseP [Dechloromonas sp. HYN0024]AXS80033.1 RIP metalloprotease RseP [Dechloromonas sp. HYN0024]
MNNIPFYLAAFLVVLGVLIVVHELGHYLAARFCGVKVLRFSVGFGRMLWKKRLGQDRTEWAISIFPLGGYVKMLDEREGKVAEEEVHRAFNRQSVGKRSIIVAAGPLANFALAILIYWGVFMHGSEELLPMLGAPPNGTPAAMAAVGNGELVRSLDGQPVATWDDLRWMILQKAVDHESVVLEVVNERDEISIRRLYLSAAGEQGWEGDALERLGIRFYRPEMPPVIGKVVANGVAERAGLQNGDRVLALAGKEISSWYDLVTIIRDSASRPLRIEFERQGEVLSVDVVPDAVLERGQTVGKIGVAVAPGPKPAREVKAFVRYGIIEAAGRALEETWDKSVFSLVMMGKMLTGEVSWKNLSGPVTIADYAGQSARLGLDYYLKFMALVSISLGVLNLLPIPVLDGGHLLYHMIEVVRRRPLSERAMEIGQQVGMSILFALMAFAFFNDLTRLFNG